MITTILTGALELCAPVFLFLSAWRMTRRNGPGLRGAAARIAAAFGLYWAIFLPRLIYLRATGRSDIGRMTILREALTLGHSVVPFAGLFGCYAAGVLLLLALSRVRALGKWGTVFLYMVAPVTAAAVLRFYAPGLPMVQRAMENLIPHITMMGAGGAARRLQGRTAAHMARYPQRTRRALTWAMLLAGIAGTMLGTVEVGALQLVGNRVSFPVPVGALCASLAVLAALRLVFPGEAAPAEREAAPAARPLFARVTTDALKGAAVVMMFAHHFFTFPEWFICEGSYPASQGFTELMRLPLAMCVPVFAFLTGFFYARRPREKRTMAHSLGKIGEVLAGHALALLVLLALSRLCGVRTGAGDALLELVGLRSEVSLFNWYICFYILAMLMLPLLCAPHAGPAGTFALTILLPVLLATAVRALMPYGSLASVAAQAVLDGVCPLGAGVLAARFAAFGQLPGRMSVRRALLCLLLGAGAMLARHFAPRLILSLPGLGESWQLRVSMDMLYAPVCVFALGSLLAAAPRALLRPLAAMGRQSLSMWLLSAAFFGASAPLCQRLLYAPVYPVFVLLWGLELCYVGACALSRLRAAVGKIAVRAFTNR